MWQNRRTGRSSLRVRSNVTQIIGAERLISVFGHWPSFHDAEVVRPSLERAARAPATHECPRVNAETHAFDRTSEVGSDGTYVLRNKSLVTLEFRLTSSVRCSCQSWAHRASL